MRMAILMQTVAAMAAVAAASAAEVETGAPFADGMVLQRGRPVPVWGWADPGTKVEVSFAGVKRVATAGADRRWRVDLPPMEASKERRELKVNDRIFRDVVVGEVWFCSGQSNMELRLVGDSPRARDRQGALVAQTTFRPFIRFAHMKTGVRIKPSPKPSHPVKWLDFRPENLQTNVSALAFYYALELYGALDVPIGMVGTYRGGSRLEPWVPNEGFRSVPGLEAQAEYVPAEGTNFSKEALLKLNPKIIKGHISTIFQPSVHWNAMVEPWAPFACRGMIWYQGESNTPEPEIYDKKMQALYNGWALRFENPNFKLYFVQLAPYGAGTVGLQESQERFARSEKNAAMAVITDIGNPRDIHPNEKELAAKRLAVHAFKHDYGFPNVKADSPTLVEAYAAGTNVVLRFRDAEKMYVYNMDFSMTAGFELAGADGEWKPAKIVNLKTRKRSNGKEYLSGEIDDGPDIVITAQGVREAKQVRYLHSRPWYGSVYNEVNLPIGPFHADVALISEREKQ